MLELLLVSFWGPSMLIWHLVLNIKKLQLDLSSLFLLKKKKKKRCHGSIERLQKDTRMSSSIPHKGLSRTAVQHTKAEE